MQDWGWAAVIISQLWLLHFLMYFLYNWSSCPWYLDYLSTKIVAGWKIRMSLSGLYSQLCGENNHVELSFFIWRKMCSLEHKILETHFYTLRKRNDSVTFPSLSQSLSWKWELQMWMNVGYLNANYDILRL